MAKFGQNLLTRILNNVDDIILSELTLQSFCITFGQIVPRLAQKLPMPILNLFSSQPGSKIKSSFVLLSWSWSLVENRLIFSEDTGLENGKESDQRNLKLPS